MAKKANQVKKMREEKKKEEEKKEIEKKEEEIEGTMFYVDNITYTTAQQVDMIAKDEKLSDAEKKRQIENLLRQSPVSARDVLKELGY